MSEWRAGQARVSASCSAMSETLLFATEGKRVYSEAAFAQAQADHMAQVSCIARMCLQGVCQSMHRPHCKVPFAGFFA